ncbi:hypothetical protein PR048_009763 [Dryococelus australis]|uniref:Uncharacterized protein n=1 Tax=Dryococelus australis TaxID=614101 RepID=A0ABQ9I0S4_9NEOP|nr:hypothetical protein PR048_009763 [Dryococelus australis]
MAGGVSHRKVLTNPPPLLAKAKDYLQDALATRPQRPTAIFGWDLFTPVFNVNQRSATFPAASRSSVPTTPGRQCHPEGPADAAVATSPHFLVSTCILAALNLDPHLSTLRIAWDSGVSRGFWGEHGESYMTVIYIPTTFMSIWHQEEGVGAGLQLHITEGLLIEKEREGRGVMYSNVLLLATSNLTGSIDPAFLDRADISQYIGLPPQQGIYQIYLSALKELERVTMEQQWNARAGEMGDPQQNLLTSGIVQHDSHLRKSGYDPARD